MDEPIQSLKSTPSSRKNSTRSQLSQKGSANSQLNRRDSAKSDNSKRDSVKSLPNVETCGITDDFPILAGTTASKRRLDGSFFGGANVITDSAERPEILNTLFTYIDENDQSFVEVLTEAVSIRSISAWPEARSECFRMVQWTANKLDELGFEIDVRKIGEEEIDGKKVPLPPIILASLGNDPSQMTLLIYGHLDVQPAKQSEGWVSDPFMLRIDEEEKLVGRGVSDDKGPVLGWIHAIEAYIRAEIPIPINIKFILETMLESGSEGLGDLLNNQKNEFLADVDLVLISDSYWLSKQTPCITYGLRGLCYFFAEVECGSRDLHSGVFGGAVRDALPDLLWLLNQLVDENGNILIPGIMDNVCPVLPDEEELIDAVDFNLEYFKEESGVKGLRYEEDARATLMARWRFPALTIHGIQGACGDPGCKTVIPRKVIGKFSIRIVPNQKPDRIDRMVSDYLQEKWQERGSPNKFQCYMADDGFAPFCANPFHPSFRAARQATAWAYETIPDMTREGGTLERLLLLQQVIPKNILLIPMGSCDDKPHGSNEKLNLNNYIQGTKLFAALIHELSLLEKGDL